MNSTDAVPSVSWFRMLHNLKEIEFCEIVSVTLTACFACSGSTTAFLRTGGENSSFRYFLEGKSITQGAGPRENSIFLNLWEISCV